MVKQGIEYGIMIKGATPKRHSGLQPCSKCGNEAIFVSYDNGWFVKCTCCEMMLAKQISVVTETIIPFDTMKDAAEVWNKRRDVALKDEELNPAIDPDLVIKRRNYRAGLIVESLKNADGLMTAADIAEETGLSLFVVRNHMTYVKNTYPQVKVSPGKKGYYWDE